jgi:transcriptional regulator with XRE-family HTH domain
MYPNLKLTIFKRGLRQNHLARELGINEVALSKIIHGVREPSPALRTVLCQYLGVDENWLFEKYTRNEIDEGIPQAKPMERKNGDS